MVGNSTNLTVLDLDVDALVEVLFDRASIDFASPFEMIGGVRGSRVEDDDEGVDGYDVVSVTMEGMDDIEGIRGLW